MHVNNDYQRNANLSKVFETVWKNPNFSRIDIARKLGLYRSTVSNIIGTLVDSTLICEGERGNATEKGGRKPVFLSVNPDFGCVIGVELQLDTYHVSLLSFDGQPLFFDEGATPVDKNLLDKPEELFVSTIDSIIKKAAELVSEHKLRPLAISVGIPGIIDSSKGLIVRSDPFRLKNFDYQKNLYERYGIPLFMENDARCCSWLQLALNKSSGKKDFLCVLARTYAGNPLLTYPESYGKGIGIGLSFVMNGRIINGRNFAAGEYISRSWTTYQKGQTGLPEAVLKTVDTVDDSYAEWVRDLFGTLTIMIPLLQPETVYVHGQPLSRRAIIDEVIAQRVPQFSSIMKSCNSELVIMDDDAYGIAKGAALMVIQKLFEVGPLESESGAVSSSLSWDGLFELQQKSVDGSILKGF